MENYDKPLFHLNQPQLLYLDLDKITLYGFETEKSDLVIDSIIRGIEAGDEFPPVPVLEIDGDYFLHPYLRICQAGWMPLDGGHNRAVGHYIAGKPLKCMVTKGVIKPSDRIPISEIVLKDDDGKYKSEYQSRKRICPKYR